MGGFAHALSTRNRIIAHSTDLETGAVVDRDFEIVALAGRGSFSTVYEARQRSKNRRPVALKVLHRGIQSQIEKINGRTRNPYLKEQFLCQRLKDTAVCRVLKVGATLEGRYYAALEWAGGVTLEEHMQLNRSGLDAVQASDIIAQLGRTLVVMHDNRVIHRDLKPSNIMIALNGEGHAEARILDFGIAKLADEVDVVREDDMLVGTPAYMSPEQAAGEATDYRSDIFSLGAIAYEILTGSRHIQLDFGPGRNSEEYVTYLLSDKRIPAKRASAVNHQLSREIDLILNRALNRDPAMRPPSVDLLMEELIPALHAAEPVPKQGLLARLFAKSS